MTTPNIQPSAIIADNVRIGEGSLIGNNVTIQEMAVIGRNVKIWDNSYIRTNACIGDNCIIARGVFIDSGAKIGNNVKIQNRNNISLGVELEDGVFVGPNVTFSNDKYPRSVNPDETLKSASDWVCVKTTIKKGASLGAGCVIVCGVDVGEWAMVGAGAVVTKSIPDHALVVGNPAKIVGWVSKSGHKMSLTAQPDNYVIMHSTEENEDYRIPLGDYSNMD